MTRVRLPQIVTDGQGGGIITVTCPGLNLAGGTIDASGEEGSFAMGATAGAGSGGSVQVHAGAITGTVPGGVVLMPCWCCGRSG